MEGFISSRVGLELAGLTMLPSKDGPIWIEISVLRNQSIELLQRRAIGVLQDNKILSNIGDLYRPHITVARAINTIRMPSIDFDYNVVRRKGVEGRISIGMCGPNYQYEKIVFETASDS